MNQIQHEQIIFEPGKSFKLFSPNLRNYFYWHYHAELELVFVEGDSGIRHVGAHLSDYTESDLVLIGPNIPHLNFDYKLTKEYKQVVIQLRENFMSHAIEQSPEFLPIKELFRKAGFGIAFHGITKSTVAEKLKHLEHKNNFVQLLEILEIFHLLAQSPEITILNKEDISFKLFRKDKIRMGTIYEYIDAHYDKKPDVNKVAEKVHLTTPAFCRYFKKQTNMTFTDFVNLYRIDMAKNLLMQNHTITDTCYSIGFESLSYFSHLFKQHTGKNPSSFKKEWLHAGDK